jgi:hypothetical protein
VNDLSQDGERFYFLIRSNDAEENKEHAVGYDGWTCRPSCRDTKQVPVDFRDKGVEKISVLFFSF